MKPTVLILLILGAAVTLLSLPLLGFAVLGFIGILADVGPAENRQIGFGFLKLGLPVLAVGLTLCIAAAWAHTRRR